MPSVAAGVDKLVARKFGPGGPFHPDTQGAWSDTPKVRGSALPPYGIHELVTVEAPTSTMPSSKLPGTVPTVHVLMYLQAQHLDVDFYDDFSRPAPTWPTHADHQARWHCALDRPNQHVRARGRRARKEPGSATSQPTAYEAGAWSSSSPHVEPFVKFCVRTLFGVRYALAQHVRVEIDGSETPIEAISRMAWATVAVGSVHAFALVGDVEGAGPIRILGGDADRAVVGVAPLRLDATHRHHHGSRRVGVVRALDQAFDDVVSGGDLAACPDPYPVAQTRSHQGVVHGHQPVGERKADVVFVFQGRGGGSALGAVDDDEVGRHRFGQHRLAERQHVDSGADTELEATGFPPASSRSLATNMISSRGV